MDVFGIFPRPLGGGAACAHAPAGHSGIERAPAARRERPPDLRADVGAGAPCPSRPPRRAGRACVRTSERPARSGGKGVSHKGEPRAGRASLRLPSVGATRRRFSRGLAVPSPARHRHCLVQVQTVSKLHLRHIKWRLAIRV